MREPAERAIARDNAMAGNTRRVRILVQGLPDGTIGLAAERVGDLLVGGHSAARDALGDGPDALVERCHTKDEGAEV